MWKREEPVRPSPPVSAPPAPIAAAPVPHTPHIENVRQEKVAVNIGKSVIIKGELSGSEDLTIEGQVEGKIELRQNLLTIGPNAKIKAQVFAKTVVVEGHVTGNISAGERVDIRDKGVVEGNLAAPRVAIADGAHFRGSIDMQQGGGKMAEGSADVKPISTPQPAAVASGPTAIAR
jgi:cytoskeletal protein CcmA (bactofilin family)